MKANLLEQIASVSGRLKKEELIATMDEDTRRLVAMALDPNITFGITIDDEDDWVDFWHKKPPDQHDHTVDEFWCNVEMIATRLMSRELSGNAARSAVDEELRCAPTPIDIIWACRFFNKNLRAGFDITTLNKIFEGSVEKFAVQLCEVWEGGGLQGEWIFEPKLNGNRLVIPGGNATSRNGKPYPQGDEVIRELREAEGGWFFSKFVPDGEMMGDLGFDQSSGALRRKTKDKKGRKDAKFTYYIFDLFTIPEWETQNTESLRCRKVRLKEFFERNPQLRSVAMVPWTLVKDPTHDQIQDITRKFVEAGFEGSVAKRLDAVARFKRGPDLLKCKLFYDAELRIKDFYEGKGKHRGTLGGVIVEGDITWGHYGHPQLPYHVISRCGSGFDDATRDLVWKDQDGWRDAVVQVQFQEVTKKLSLQFPVFVMRRKDKE